MLTGLARWLRAAGYDTAAAWHGQRDGALVERATRESRLLLTRDRGIGERRAAAGIVLLLDGHGLESWAEELSRRAGVDWMLAPFTRCLVCNTPLDAAPSEAAGLVPEGSRHLGPLRWCSCCLKPYWRGGHVERMAARLTRWRGYAAR